MQKIFPEQQASETLDMDSKKNLESQLRSIQKLSYEERIEAHENALKLLHDLKTLGEQIRDQSQSSS